MIKTRQVCLFLKGSECVSIASHFLLFVLTNVYPSDWSILGKNICMRVFFNHQINVAV